MLSNLFTASQRHLLSLLMREKKPLLAFNLAKLADMPYSTAHTTLQGLVKTGLVLSEAQEGRNYYGLNRSDARVNAFFDLLKPEMSEQHPDSQSASTEDVRWNLAGLGAPLLVSEKPRKELSPEQTLAMSLRLARNDPTVARAFPLALATSFHTLDQPRLKYLAKTLGETKTLGFFLDLTGELAQTGALRQAANGFMDRRVKRSEPFFRQVHSSRYSRELENLRTPALARKWHFTMNMDMDSFRSFFQKFHHDNSKVQPKRH